MLDASEGKQFRTVRHHLQEPSSLGDHSPTEVGYCSDIRVVRQLRLTRNRAAQDKQETRGRLFERSEFTASPVWPITRGKPQGWASSAQLILSSRIDQEFTHSVSSRG